jgi:hypothetical protein
MPDLGSVALNCAQTPLWFPPDISLNSLTVTTTSGIKLFAPIAGSLQILSRKQQGGAGDGVNIDENASISADFRGQRYNFVEAIFHVKGLHIFPGRTSPYAAEYHIHMKTLIKPERSLTIVIPVYMVSDNEVGHPYFAACRAVVDSTAKRPTLASLIPYGSDVVQYQGPDLRGRTKIQPTNDTCTNLTYDRQYLLVMTPVGVNPSECELIPREGSFSADPRDLPETGVEPTQTSIPRAQILKQVVLARPGIIDLRPAATPACPTVSSPGSPDSPDSPGSPDPDEIQPSDDSTSSNGSELLGYIEGILCAFGIVIGVIIIDFLSGFFWSHLFTGDAVKAWIPMKAFIIVASVITVIFYYRGFLNYWGIS